MALAEKQSAPVPLMVGHHLMGVSLAFTGALVDAHAHFNQALALYNPAVHRALAMRFGQDVGVAVLTRRSYALWTLGYPDAAMADIAQVRRYAREIGQAATSMYVLGTTSEVILYCGDYAAATALIDELIAWADEKNSSFWKAHGMLMRGWALALTGNAADAIQIITSGFVAYRSTGARLLVPSVLSCLAMAHSELSQFDAARQCIVDAMMAIETTKQRWCEADIYRKAGGIELMSPTRNGAKAEGYFQHALDVARQQQAKSWELRAAMSMARLWRDQGKKKQASDLLVPIYDWFTEGFETRDLKEAKALLESLSS